MRANTETSRSSARARAATTMSILNLSFATVYIAHIDRVVKYFVFRLTWFRFILKQKMNLSRNLRGTNEFGLEVQENVRNVTGIGLTNQNGLTIIGCRESPTTVTERVNIVLKFLGEGECGMITIVIVRSVLFVKKTDFPVNHLIMIFFFLVSLQAGIAISANVFIILKM